jgi:hypothetical protein
MTTLYVVMENSFEYNDETYYQPEGGGGLPRAAYTTLAKAEKALNAINARWLRENNPREYSAYGEELIAPKNRALVRALGVDPEDLDEPETLEDYTDAQLSALMGYLPIQPYEICEVKVENDL